MFSLRPSARLRRAVALPAATAMTAGLLIAATTTPAAAAVTPHAPVTLPAGVEPMPPYQPQTYCDPVAKPGVLAFGKLLTATYKDTSIVSIARACGTDTSEHYQGRALDWGAYYKNPAQVKEVQATFAWLFATDAHGNKNANLRRLGIMYIIWNKRMWGSWSQTWEPYSCSGETACHQNHVHFSFDWSGAMKKTSFWTGKVSQPMATPNFVYKSTAYAQKFSVSAAKLAANAPFSVLAGATYRVTVSGTYKYASATGAVADAECSTKAGSSWTSLAPGDSTASTGLRDLDLAGRHWWPPTTSTGDGCNTKTHTYSRLITFQLTRTLPAVINDTTRSGHSGSLAVTVQRVS
jgi:hypothetical protein